MNLHTTKIKVTEGFFLKMALLFILGMFFQYNKQKAICQAMEPQSTTCSILFKKD